MGNNEVLAKNQLEAEEQEQAKKLEQAVKTRVLNKLLEPEFVETLANKIAGAIAKKGENNQ